MNVDFLTVFQIAIAAFQLWITVVQLFVGATAVIVAWMALSTWKKNQSEEGDRFHR